MRSPEESSSGEFLDFMHLYSVTPQDGGSQFSRDLAKVDEQNFLVSKNRAATKWWRAIHTTLPKRARPLWEGDSRKVCSEKARESTEI